MSLVERAPFTPRDLLAFAFVSDPQLSPDGRQVAYVHTTFDKQDNGYRSQIWVAAADPGSGEAPRPFTRGPKKDTHPRWSPDGRTLAFLSNREGESSQIWVLPTTGGEARQLTRVKGGIAEFTWRPTPRRCSRWCGSARRVWSPRKRRSPRTTRTTPCLPATPGG